MHQSTGRLQVPGCKNTRRQQFKNKRSTPMTHIAFETNVRVVLKSHMHPCQGNCVATGRVVVNYARAARSFSAGIKCRHCTHTHTYICAYIYTYIHTTHFSYFPYLIVVEMLKVLHMKVHSMMKKNMTRKSGMVLHVSAQYLLFPIDPSASITGTQLQLKYLCRSIKNG